MGPNLSYTSHVQDQALCWTPITSLLSLLPMDRTSSFIFLLDGSHSVTETWFPAAVREPSIDMETHGHGV
ncbi:LOW QUALITY PROTEIN: uncharacterized protein LOC110226557 [Arabidopsis lyrata subsp. lyrata]|uniref:LOW QUALITY PROTEIN: uncharacterized protein LOC110226557 n=1 Tax=Arabidopsis lyrata subsp. lyrata TaxID=81972 RepID=UPI000A29DC1E|nr:LOW QUALITY PROTEIN: uncharacterized protein LOC110226557 [Arabidopsis lyrata subsp. lyrata]|eukprot:XP_020874158.1 LOW QUALITY PROTEIN: uncharacterized protein LOC110226557 [Arabidopsis lyrata subsp. lyrata]